jgi:ABC-type multidrug transport system ATPase subunit
VVVRSGLGHRGRFLRRERRLPTSRCQGRRTLTDGHGEDAERVDGTRALLAARGVGRRYGAQRALSGASLELHAGEAVALVGPNGAGKSTLLSILAGALGPTEGTIAVADPPPRVGWVPQRPAQYARLTARENLELFARLEGVDDVRAAVERLLALVELPDDGKPSGALSVGNQQRLNVALALLGGPQVLLLDEPTAALDPGQRRRVWALVAEVKAAGGAVAFATQNVDEIEHVADRVVVLRDGEVVFTGPLAEYERMPEADVFA